MTNPVHVLVIAVDQLAVSDVNCLRELKATQKSGFDLLCKDSVRFTHAFTPSLLTQPALTSLLTGLYPVEHHVRNNGPDFLSTQMRSVAQTAFTNNFRTALFSGGAPILRSSGLQQGFELFDENISPTAKKIFRSADEISRSYLTWTKEAEGNQFAVIYLQDLLFTHKETVDEFGEARNLSLESQIENLDVNLHSLFSQMQKNHQWDQTTIILTGLNGHGDDNTSFKSMTNQQLNLHSSQTQVALLIKPSRKPRDEGLAWSFDSSVSLVDIGKTLMDLVGPSGAQDNVEKQKSSLKRISLVNALGKPAGQTSEDRWILSESAWGLWKKSYPLVYSLRKKDLLMIHDFQDHFFNTLTDKAEVAEISNSEASLSIESAEIQQLKNQLGLNNSALQLSIADSSPSALMEQALKFMESNQWQDLKSLGKKNSKSDWVALAERNLQEKKVSFNDPCLKLIDAKDSSAAGRRTCNNRKILALFDELIINNTSEGGKKDFVKKKLLHIWKNEVLFDRIMKSNFQLGEIWNLSENHQNEHLTFLMALNHPNSAKIRTLLIRDSL